MIQEVQTYLKDDELHVLEEYFSRKGDYVLENSDRWVYNTGDLGRHTVIIDRSKRFGFNVEIIGEESEEILKFFREEINLGLEKIIGDVA